MQIFDPLPIITEIVNDIEKESYLPPCRERSVPMPSFFKRLGGKYLNLLSRGYFKLFRKKGRMPEAGDSPEYVPFHLERAFSFNYLKYWIANRSAFDLALFSPLDRAEVVRFLRAHFEICFKSQILKSSVFDKEDLLIQSEYRATRINRFADRVSIELPNSKTYIMPNEKFVIDVSLFYHNLGLDSLPDSKKAELRNSVFIDVGGYSGDSALILQGFQPKAIWIFEPSQSNIEIIRKTIELNHARNIVVHHCALGEKESVANFSFNGPMSIVKETGTESVAIQPLDSFVNKNPEVRVGLIKIDTEGFEAEVIAGAEETIRKHMPVIVLSIYHKGQHFSELIPKIKALNQKYQFRFLNLNRSTMVLERVVLGY